MEQLKRQHLNEEESNELLIYEEVIQLGLKTFVEVGNALLAIRDKRLYREEFATFEEYCKERWGMDRRNAYRHIEAAEVVSNIEMWSMDHKPKNVRQARPLTKLEPEVQREAWSEVVEKHGDNITAKKVEKVVDEWIDVDKDVKESKAQPMFVADTPEEIIRKANELKKQRKQEKKQRQEEERKQLAEKYKDVALPVDYFLGDFEQVLDYLDDQSVDCIITDPPYPYDYIECWSKLSRFAAKKLKPGGFCIAYSGQMHLPEVYKRMSEHLNYYWTFNLIHTGSRQLINGRNVFCGWKPLLVYQNGFELRKEPCDDFILGTGMEKDSHRWQQSLNELDFVIDKFTDPGDLICEPFAGGGTTIIAAIKNGRSIVAAEIDKESYQISKSRISEWVK